MSGANVCGSVRLTSYPTGGVRQCRLSHAMMDSNAASRSVIELAACYCITDISRCQRRVSGTASFHVSTES